MGGEPFLKAALCIFLFKYILFPLLVFLNTVSRLFHMCLINSCTEGSEVQICLSKENVPKSISEMQ